MRRIRYLKTITGVQRFPYHSLRCSITVEALPVGAGIGTGSCKSTFAAHALCATVAASTPETSYRCPLRTIVHQGHNGILGVHSTIALLKWPPKRAHPLDTNIVRTPLGPTKNAQSSAQYSHFRCCLCHQVWHAPIHLCHRRPCGTESPTGEEAQAAFRPHASEQRAPMARRAHSASGAPLRSTRTRLRSRAPAPFPCPCHIHAGHPNA